MTHSLQHNASLNPSPVSRATPMRASSPELARLEAELERQDRELQTAFTTLSGLADSPLPVPVVALSEINDACSQRPKSAPELFTLQRC